MAMRESGVGASLARDCLVGKEFKAMIAWAGVALLVGVAKRWLV